MIVLAAEALDRVRAGHVDILLENCLADVRGMAWSFSQSSGISAEDLLQEVALKLCRKLDKVLVARNPMAYARVLARFTMIDHYRKVARRRRIIGRVMRLDERLAL